MAFRFFRVSALIAQFLARAAAADYQEKNWPLVAKRRAKLLHKASKKALRALGAKVEVIDPTNALGSVDKKADQRILIIANHCSYLDTITVSSLVPTLYVSSVERQNDGFLGQIARLAGTIFVDRINKSNLPSDILTLGSYFEQRIPVCIFPEGTTSNGQTILPFKSSLLRAVEGTETKILPICIRYVSARGKRLHGDEVDLLAWHGDMDFLPHFRRLCGLGSIGIQVEVLPIFSTKPDQTRKEITKILQNQIQEAYSRPLSS